MDYLIIPIVAAGASLLTFFAGFGLGTLLTPIFALFFPIELAVAMTAIVHFLNNMFKLSLVGKFAVKKVIIRFGIPATFAAIVGALVLTATSELPIIFSYQIHNRTFTILPIKLIIALLIIAFTLFELIPKLRNLEVDKRYLSLGGVLSGFFGGLSGHQGALRSAFLARLGLTKEQFIGTGTVIACLIDLSRMIVYSKHISTSGITNNISLLIVTTLAAFIGAFLGNHLLKKTTMERVQVIVSVMLIMLAIGLGLGLI